MYMYCLDVNEVGVKRHVTMKINYFVISRRRSSNVREQNGKTSK